MGERGRFPCPSTDGPCDDGPEAVSATPRCQRCTATSGRGALNRAAQWRAEPGVERGEWNGERTTTSTTRGPAGPAGQKVLVPAAQGARRALDDTGLGDGLAPLELLARQVEVDTAGQPVPPVEAVLVPVKMYFADHETTAENVMDDQGGTSQWPQAGCGCPGNATQIAR